jgi:hypothetical protein
MVIHYGQGESIEGRQILVVFENRISSRTIGLFTNDVVEGNPALAVVKSVWKYVK